MQYLRYTEHTYHFRVSNCSNASYLLNWRISYFIFKKSFFEIHSTANSKAYKRTNTVFYSPSNALCSSDESAQIKHFKHHTFNGMCSLFTWFNRISVNPFHATGLFLYTLKTSENQMFTDVFRGYRKRPVAWNGLMKTYRDWANVEMCIILKAKCLYSFTINSQSKQKKI